MNDNEKTIEEVIEFIKQRSEYYNSKHNKIVMNLAYRDGVNYAHKELLNFINGVE